MKVLVKEKIAASGVEMLRNAGFEVDVGVEMSHEEMLAAIGEYDGLIVRSATDVDAEVLAAARTMKVVGRAGVGVDNIDVEEATRRGIIVVNAPQSNVLSAAEHTIALLLALARNVPQAHVSLKINRKWERSSFTGVEISDKTLGLLGLGRVGTLVAQRAKGVGMKVMAYDPYVSGEKFQSLGITPARDLEELLKTADFLSIHLPKTKETMGLLGDHEFQLMKDGVRIVNTARGGIFTEETLLKYLKEGKVAGAGIDVFESEPCCDSPLFELDNVIVTPHLGASTGEAQERAGTIIAEQVLAALKGEFVSNAVNIPMIPAEQMEAVRPFLPLAETLGKLFSSLQTDQLSRVDIEYAGDLAAFETRLLTVAFLKGVFESVVDEPVSFVNAPVFAEERGIEVRETKTSTSREYTSLITVTGGEVRLGGTATPPGYQPRLVRLLDFEMDLAPSEYMLLVHNEDKPGMIGMMGTILGKNNVNIAAMQVGRERARGNAVSVLTVDERVSDDVLKELRAVDGITDARFIAL